MARETHADVSNTNFQEDLVLSIKCISSELGYNGHEFVAFSHRADRPNLRIDPPKFNGDDPSGWIYKVQSYFDYFETSEEDRLRLVGLLFEHRTSNWFLYQHDNKLVTSWPEFLEAVKHRFDPPRALRLAGAISGAYVETLISGSSTHNFIHPNIVKQFRWEVTPTDPPFCVYVGNFYGESLFCKQKCNHTKFSLQGHKFVVDLFVLPIHGPKMVLGAPWLKSLGEIYRNYGEHTMEFTHKDKLVTLRGLWEKGRHIFYNARKD